MALVQLLDHADYGLLYLDCTAGGMLMATATIHALHSPLLFHADLRLFVPLPQLCLPQSAIVLHLGSTPILCRSGSQLLPLPVFIQTIIII